MDVTRWLDPLDPTRKSSLLFQTANRISYAVWLRSHGVDTWLCHLLYLDDPRYHSTSKAAWEEALEKAERELGVDGLDLPFVGHAFLALAGDRLVELGETVDVCLHRELEAGGSDAAAELDHVDRR